MADTQIKLHRDFARRQVRSAIARGELVRPKACEKCGAADNPTSDGRTSIQAHHFNGHENVLDVQWLCVRCHRDETPAPYGDRSSKSKLTWELVRYFRQRYAAEGKYYAMAREHGVHPKTVYSVVANKSWPQHADPLLALQGSKP